MPMGDDLDGSGVLISDKNREYLPIDTRDKSIMRKLDDLKEIHKLMIDDANQARIKAGKEAPLKVVDTGLSAEEGAIP